MRSRRWVLVLATLAGMSVFGGYVGWRATRANDRIKQILLAKIGPFVDGESSIEKVELGLNTLHLKGVKLAPKDRSFSIEIEDIRLGYKLWNLFRYRFSPHKVAHEVVLIHPEVVVRDAIPGEVERGEEQRFADLHEFMKELETVKRIAVADGEILLQNSYGRRVRLAHSLNGWFQANPTDSAVVRLSGKLFESMSNNLSMEGKINLKSAKPIRIHIQVKDSELSPELPLLLPEYIQVASGRMLGELMYDPIQKTTGFLELRDGTLSFKNENLAFQNVNAKGAFRGKDLVIEGTVQRFLGSPLEISGTIQDVFNPRLDLSIRCSRFDMPAFFQGVIPGADISFLGKARFGLHFSGLLHNAEMEGRFVSSDFSAYGIHFDGLNATIGLKDSVLTVDGDGVQGQSLRLGFNGRIDFSDDRRMTSLGVDVQGDFMPSLPHWIRRRIGKLGGEMGIRFAGDIKNLLGEAKGMLALASVEGDTLRFIPDIKYEQKNLRVQVLSNGSFEMDGEVRSPFHGNPKWDIRFSGLNSIVEMLMSAGIRRSVQDMDFSGNFTGSKEAWRIWLKGLKDVRRDSTRMFELDLVSSGKLNERKDIEIQAVYYSPEGRDFPLTAYGTVSKDYATLLRCEIGRMLVLDGRYPFDSDKELQANIRLSDFRFEKLHEIFPRTRSYVGELRGGIQVGGTRTLPKLAFNVSLHNGYFHSVGIFDGGFEFQWKDRNFQSCDLSFRKDGSLMFAGRAQRTEQDSLRGEFLVQDVDLSDLFLALTGKEKLDGLANAKMIVGGSVVAPIIRGAVEVRDGSMGSFPFQNLHVEVIDTLWMGTEYGSGKLSFRNGRLDIENGLKVDFWGDLPHGGGEDADVSIQAQGNILGLLPEVSDFFKKANGKGEIYTRWAGRPGDWVLGSARARVDDGMLELAEFVKKVEHIKGEAELLEGERFVQISNLTGVVDGEAFSLTNASDEDDKSEFSPLASEKLGVHFGVLRLGSRGKGIRVHLPGLMENGEEGWIAFGGMEPTETFLIAGPGTSPLLRGTLSLTDARLTYPFLSLDGDTGTTKIVEFLEKIRWDLRVIPQKDAHYVRSIETPMGNVDADLKLKDSNGLLRIQGCVEDGTFEVWGNLVSTEGNIIVLDHYFRPERVTFDYPRGAKDPIIAGRAYTTVTDSMGMPSTVWLSVAVKDDATGLERGEGPWGDVHFQFSTDNPNLGRTEADLLAGMGYSADHLKDRAYDALGTQVENMVFRPLFRPLERGMRRYLGLDVVRFSSMFSRNIVQSQTVNGLTFDPTTLLRSTKLMLGKYLASGFFITYSGQIKNGWGLQYMMHRVGFRHALTFEYTIRPDLFLQMEYTYDSLLLSDRREDKRIWLRHIFPF